MFRDYSPSAADSIPDAVKNMFSYLHNIKIE